ncbi:hypothetical protein NXW11_24720 [Bacteroides thetaiotaomicron]|nr:hypothetical protein [Bacteroides thetaiotaomicron]
MAAYRIRHGRHTGTPGRGLETVRKGKDVLPNLKWMPSTSVTPGADHQIFWGTIRPIDDPFWNEHRPGDRWNCKCTLSSTDEAPTAVPDENGQNKAHDGLENNPGKRRQTVFRQNTPTLLKRIREQKKPWTHRPGASTK